VNQPALFQVCLSGHCYDYTANQSKMEYRQTIPNP